MQGAPAEYGVGGGVVGETGGGWGGDGGGGGGRGGGGDQQLVSDTGTKECCGRVGPRSTAPEGSSSPPAGPSLMLPHGPVKAPAEPGPSPLMDAQLWPPEPLERSHPHPGGKDDSSARLGLWMRAFEHYLITEELVCDRDTVKRHEFGRQDTQYIPQDG